MQLALYRAERPETFEEVIGQKHIVRILQNQLKNESVSQAYLFTGTHGTGKTSTARILAKALNCVNADDADKEGVKLPCGECENCMAIKEGRFPDVIELDAASNNGVDDLRAIIDLVKYPPSIGKYKVYIIDEVHMLTQSAENAFLKTLEEPPEYAIFILATTDPQKVRATIKSRCMQLNFKRVSEAELIEGMRRICDKKSIKTTDEALGLVAIKANGSVRDALSLLEQSIAASSKQGELSVQDVLDSVGAAGEDFYIELTEAVSEGQLGRALELIDEVSRDGKESKQLMKDWLEHYRNLMVSRYVEKAEKIINASSENVERIREQAKQLDSADIERAIKLLSEYINLGRYSDRPRILLETAAVKLASGAEELEIPSVKATKLPKPSAKASDAKTATTKAMPVEQPRAAKSVHAPVDKTTPVEKATPVEKNTQTQAVAPSGNAQEMWNRIVEEMSRSERGFGLMVGKNSYGKSFDGDELLVVVKKNKMAIAQESLDEAIRVAKNLFGAVVYVTMIPGEVERQTIEAVEQEPAEIVIEEDSNWDEMASDLGSLLGVEVDVVDR